MDATQKITALHNVFVRVLEEQMFLFADDAAIAEIDFPASMLAIHIVYHGDAHGGISLILPQDLCREITASVLGIEESDLPANCDITDAAKELLNITCGQFLTDIYGDKPVMNLQPPTAEKLTAENFAAIRENFSGLAFVVDEHPILLSLND